MSEELKAILKREPVEIEIEENSMGELPFVKTRILQTQKEARVILNRVAELEEQNKLLFGVQKAQDERLNAAAERVGLEPSGCDTADWLAELVLEKEQRIKDLETALKLASTMLFDERSEIKFWQYLEDRGIELITES